MASAQFEPLFIYTFDSGSNATRKIGFTFIPEMGGVGSSVSYTSTGTENCLPTTSVTKNGVTFRFSSDYAICTVTYGSDSFVFYPCPDGDGKTIEQCVAEGIAYNGGVDSSGVQAVGNKIYWSQSCARFCGFTENYRPSKFIESALDENGKLVDEFEINMWFGRAETTTYVEDGTEYKFDYTHNEVDYSKITDVISPNDFYRLNNAVRPLVTEPGYYTFHLRFVGRDDIRILSSQQYRVYEGGTDYNSVPWKTLFGSHVVSLFCGKQPVGVSSRYDYTIQLNLVPILFSGATYNNAEDSDDACASRSIYFYGSDQQRNEDSSFHDILGVPPAAYIHGYSLARNVYKYNNISASWVQKRTKDEPYVLSSDNDRKIKYGGKYTRWYACDGYASTSGYANTDSFQEYVPVVLYARGTATILGNGKTTIDIGSVAINNKEYDGSDDAYPIVTFQTEDRIAPEDVNNLTFNYSGVFVDGKDAGENKAVHLDCYISGSAADKYQLGPYEDTYFRNISPKILTISGTTIKPITVDGGSYRGKFYDGSNKVDAIVGTVSGKIAGDDVFVSAFGTFADSSKTVSVWKSGGKYSQNDLVLYNGAVYKATTNIDSASAVPSSSAQYTGFTYGEPTITYEFSGEDAQNYGIITNTEDPTYNDTTRSAPGYIFTSTINVSYIAVRYE